MKLGKQLLIAIVIAGMTLGGAIWFVSSITGQKKVTAIFRPGTKVYVDANRLLALHPNYEALKSLEASYKQANLKAKEKFVLNVGSTSFEDVQPKTYLRSNERDVLEASTVWESVKALSQWEAAQREALKARLMTNRSTRMDEAQFEIETQNRDIKDAEVEKFRSIVESYMYGRLNAIMKYYSLDKATDYYLGYKTSATAKDYEKLYLIDLLEKAKETRDKIIGDRDYELEDVITMAGNTIKDVKFKTTRRVDSSLSVFNLEQGKIIEKSLSVARDEVVKNMESFGNVMCSPEMMPLYQNQSIYSALPGVVAIKERKSNVSDNNIFAKRSDEIRARLIKDVKAAVSKITDSKKVNVVFTKSDGIKDETQKYYGLLKKQVWKVSGPILCDSGE